MAAGAGDVEGVELFLAKWPQDVNVKDSKTWTALMRAAWFGQKVVVAMLLERGADVRITDRWDRTARYLAGRRRHRSIATLLEKSLKKE
ncbi:MAG TPA: ankyrin repeat domain-containing protein [Bryobacteraceae bacterium]|nr:ankyrin repeat domain-containing protein [Bryobacteraceae bacterium]